MTVQPNQRKHGPIKKLTPEQIEAISERVYALLQADLRLERERARLNHRPAYRP
jgi:hypothetical protein